jgi:hypothetical protein
LLLDPALVVAALLAMVLHVAGAVGCSLIIDPRRSGPENRCAGESDCPGARCDAELGMCITDAPEAYAYVLQVTIPASDAEARPALTATAGPFVASSGDAVHDVVLRAPVPLAGRVRTEDGEPVSAEIVLTPHTGFLGPPPPAVAARTFDVLSPDDIHRENDFVTALIPGVTYDVEVRPRGEHATRHYPIRARLPLDRPQRLDVVIPSAAFELGGFVVDSAGVRQNGLELRAIEVGTGRVVSSIATTQTYDEPGEFRLRIDPGADRWVLRVSASPAYQENAVFPTVVIDPAVLVNEGTQEMPRVRVLVPNPDQGVCFAGTVEFPPELGTRPAIGATVTLRASEVYDPATGLVGSFTIQLVSQPARDEAAPIGCSGGPLPAGGFEGRVLPGDYEVEIQPLEPELGVFVGRAEIRGDTLGHVFVLPARTVLSGIVRRSIREPVVDARVRAIALGMPLTDVTHPAASRRNRSGEAITDAQGQFSLGLDVGVYDLVVLPPPSSRFPWLVRTEYRIGGSSALLRDVFDVRMPVAVRGRARFDDGSPAGRAEIRAYALLARGAGERPVPVAEATTTATGDFLLLLPPEI